MVNETLLKPLTRLQFYLPNRLDRPYISLIERVIDKHLIIDNPFQTTQPPPLKIGQNLICHLPDADAIYQFTASLINYEVKGQKSFLVLTRPDTLERIQRREFYRLKIALPIYYRIYSNIPARRPVPFRLSETKDISGGGVLFTGDLDIRKNTFLDLMIELPREDIERIPTSPANMFVCLGRVAMVKQQSQPNKIYHYGVEFKELEPQDQERIIKFIFERQTRQRRL
jgi:c-di-GMP-binding flagellar brake protein YcgR